MNNASVLHNQVQEFLSVSDGQFSEINQAVLRGTVPFISRLRQVGGAQRFTGGTIIADTVSVALLALFPRRVKISPEEAMWWQKYYSDNYGIVADLSELQVPAPTDYPTRLIVMHEAISGKCNPVAAVYKKHCEAKGFGWLQFNNDLDSVVTYHDRSGTYAIRVRDTQEAEFGNVNGENLSSQQIWDRGITTTTLPERLIDGGTYLLKTGKQLDTKVITLCAGSRATGGFIPGVGFLPNDSEVYINDWGPSDAGDDLRFRLAMLT